MAVPGAFMPRSGSPPSSGSPTAAPMPPIGFPSGSPTPEEAFAALQNLTPRSANPNASMDNALKAIDLIGQLARAIESNVSQMNPEVAKVLIDIRQKSQQAKSKLTQAAPLSPPPDLMLGMSGAAQPGSPSLGPPGLPGGLAGGGASPF